MTELKDVKRQLMDLIASYYSADKNIPVLRGKAQGFVDQAERGRAVEDQIRELEGGIEPIAAELASLKESYLTALWEQDEPEQKRLSREKKRLEGEITSIQKAVAAKRKTLASDPVDNEALIELTATLEAFDVPNAWDATRSLTTSLQAVELDLKNRVGSIQNSLLGIGVDPDQVEAYRLEHDQDYRDRKESQAQHDRVYEAQQREQAKRLQREVARYEHENLIAAGAFNERVTTRDLKPFEEDD